MERGFTINDALPETFSPSVALNLQNGGCTAAGPGATLTPPVAPGHFARYRHLLQLLGRSDQPMSRICIVDLSLPGSRIGLEIAKVLPSES